MNKIKRTVIIAGQFIICSTVVLLAFFFGWEFFLRYKLDYNEIGRYFDEENVIVYHEQAIPFYGFFFAFFSIMLILMVLWKAKARTDKK